MVRFLSVIHEKNTMRIVKDEVKKNFEEKFYKGLFIDAARNSNLDLNLTKRGSLIVGDARHAENSQYLNTTIDDLIGIEWVIDEGNNFGSALKMGLEILRKMILGRNWDTAAKLNQNYLNKLITQNMETIRNLTDEENDIEIKTLVQEKDQLSRILDGVGLCTKYQNTNVRLRSNL